jgi:hypothetical protein
MYQSDGPQAEGSVTGVPGRRCQGWGGATRSPSRWVTRRAGRPDADISAVGARRPGTSDAAYSAGTGNYWASRSKRPLGESVRADEFPAQAESLSSALHF